MVRIQRALYKYVLNIVCVCIYILFLCNLNESSYSAFLLSMSHSFNTHTHTPKKRKCGAWPGQFKTCWHTKFYLHLFVSAPTSFPTSAHTPGFSLFYPVLVPLQMQGATRRIIDIGAPHHSATWGKTLSWSHGQACPVCEYACGL